jgi:hypothetical protein
MSALVLLSLAACADAPARAPSAEQDCDRLVDSALPFAREMLTKHKAFFPFGATMAADGSVGQTGGWTGDEKPDPNELIALLEEGFRKGAASGKLRATALVVDVKTVPPGKTEKQDAILIGLDHRDGYSVHRLYPYAFVEGELVLEGPFTREGSGSVFAR